MVHCYDAGCLPGTCPCNYPQQNQLSGSHNSLGLIRGGFGTTRQGTVWKLFWHALGELSVTRDETCARPPETKEQWMRPESLSPEPSCGLIAADGGVMGFIPWNAQGMREREREGGGGGGGRLCCTDVLGRQEEEYEEGWHHKPNFCRGKRSVDEFTFWMASVGK